MRKFEMTVEDLGRFAHTIIELAGSVTQSKLDEILSRLSALEAQGQQLMAIAASTQAKLDAIGVALDSIGANLSSAVSGLTADLQALKDQLNAANNGMSETDVNNALAPLETRVAAVQTAAQALTDLDAQNPPTTTGGTGTGGGL